MPVSASGQAGLRLVRRFRLCIIRPLKSTHCFEFKKTLPYRTPPEEGSLPPHGCTA
ncbi:hypothetical protein NITGR_170115 [Nitrospina gracilis 3/211]|uniref:Uncharacterized protein n=1 Tax=Nitrospina gracilis (strain 3/211) TaxID=1266370 RepID=M1YWI9_NITG3|nr:hypothetical protein NITGR_170115 [Nitrospina gracilis 3/211]